MRIASEAMSAKRCGWNRDWLPLENDDEEGYGVHLRCISGSRVIAQLQLHRHPDNTCCIVFPQKHSNHTGTEECVRLLHEASRLSMMSNAKSLRVVSVRSPPGDPWEVALEVAGFRKAHNLSRCCTSTSPLVQELVVDDVQRIARFTAKHLHGEPGRSHLTAGPPSRHAGEQSNSTPVEIGTLVRALDQILAESNDPLAAPYSSASELLMLWSLLDADVDIYVSTERGLPIGLAVTSAQSGDNSAILEYIGIVSARHRQGIGSQLLNVLKDDIQTERPDCRHLIAVAVTGNLAASGFYQSHNFAIEEAGSLWVKSSI